MVVGILGKLLSGCDRVDVPGVCPEHSRRNTRMLSSRNLQFPTESVLDCPKRLVLNGVEGSRRDEGSSVFAVDVFKQKVWYKYHFTPNVSNSCVKDIDKTRRLIYTDSYPTNKPSGNNRQSVK